MKGVLRLDSLHQWIYGLSLLLELDLESEHTVLLRGLCFFRVIMQSEHFEMDSQWHGKCPCLIVFCLVHLTHMETGEMALKASQAATFNGWGGQLWKAAVLKRHCRWSQESSAFWGWKAQGSKGLTDPQPPCSPSEIGTENVPCQQLSIISELCQWLPNPALPSWPSTLPIQIQRKLSSGRRAATERNETMSNQPLIRPPTPHSLPLPWQKTLKHLASDDHASWFGSELLLEGFLSQSAKKTYFLIHLFQPNTTIEEWGGQIGNYRVNIHQITWKIISRQSNNLQLISFDTPRFPVLQRRVRFNTILWKKHDRFWQQSHPKHI